MTIKFNTVFILHVTFYYCNTFNSDTKQYYWYLLITYDKTVYNNNGHLYKR